MNASFRTTVLHVTTGSSESVTDLTRDCASFLAEAAGGGDGLFNIFVPHATAGVAILETGAGSDDDLLDLNGGRCEVVTGVSVGASRLAFGSRSRVSWVY